MPKPTDDGAISSAWFAWLAGKLLPYFAPLIAAEVARQLAQQKPAATPPAAPAPRKYIGE